MTLPHTYKTYTYNTGLEALRKYCAYQERCHSEVWQKAKQIKLTPAEIERAISQLIQENFLNEERFAKMYAQGKFKLKHWGPQKIKYHLTQKGISPILIREALSKIEDTQVDKTLNQLITKKMRSLSNEKNIFLKKQKLIRYLTGKGFEAQKIMNCLDMDNI